MNIILLIIKNILNKIRDFLVSYYYCYLNYYNAVFSKDKSNQSNN